MLGEFGIVRHGIRLATVVEIVASGMSELRRHRRDETGGSSLCHCLVLEQTSRFRGIERFFLRRGEVALEPRRDAPGFTAFVTMPSEAQRRVASTANSELAVFDCA